MKIVTMGLCGLFALWLGASARGADPAAEAPRIAAPSAAAARDRTWRWLEARGATDELRRRVDELWSESEASSPETRLEIIVATFALADPDAARIIEAARMPPGQPLPDDIRVGGRPPSDPWYTSNLALYHGRTLAERELFDEALSLLDKLDVAHVADPAMLLFHRAVCQQQLLLKDEALQSLRELARVDQAPQRYTAIAGLMQYDLEHLEDQTLDEAAHRMSDVQRRLALGRAGQRVQKEEDEIVAIFDELIQKIEQQQGGGGGGGQSNQSSSPAQDSTVKGSTAPGQVDKKKFKNEGGWGALPPKARAQAKDLIARDFPAHYRQAIEEYTKKQAARPAAPGKGP